MNNQPTSSFDEEVLYMKKECIKNHRFDNADYSYCIYNVCIEPSRKEVSMEQYYYVATVWCIFSCDSSVALLHLK